MIDPFDYKEPSCATCGGKDFYYPNPDAPKGRIPVSRIIEKLDQLGEMPLPPYIHEKLKEQDRYQTVYAKIEGSAAAPTAGLHFTDELMAKIKEKGIKCEYGRLNKGGMEIENENENWYGKWEGKMRIENGD